MAKKETKSRAAKTAKAKGSKKAVPKTAKKRTTETGKKAKPKTKKSKPKPKVTSTPKKTKTRTPAAAKKKTPKPTSQERATVEAVGERPDARMQSREQQDEAIKKLAYSKWEEAGCPAGDGVEFWLAAEKEVLNDK